MARTALRLIGSVLGIAVLLGAFVSLGSDFIIRSPGDATVYTVTITDYDAHTERSCSTHRDSNGQSRTTCDDHTTYVLHFNDPRYPGQDRQASVTSSWHDDTERVFFDGDDWQIVWDLAVRWTLLILAGCLVGAAALIWFGIVRPARRNSADSSVRTGNSRSVQRPPR